jgi:hypothetical protein
VIRKILVESAAIGKIGKLLIFKVDGYDLLFIDFAFQQFLAEHIKQGRFAASTNACDYFYDWLIT